MKKVILIGILMLGACAPIATAPPTPTSTKSPIITFSFPETSAPIPTDTLRPTPTLEPIRGGWNTFHSSVYGFRFHYPAVYDEGFISKTDPRAFCDKQTGEDSDGNFNIWIGNIWIIIKQTDQKLDDFSTAYVKEMSINWNISPIIRLTVDGEPAIMLEYAHKTRSGHGVKTYTIHNKDLIFVEYYVPSVYIECAPPDTGYSSIWVYEQIIKTWKFD